MKQQSENIKRLEELIIGRGTRAVTYAGGARGKCLFVDENATVQVAILSKGQKLEIHGHDVVEVVVCTKGNLKLVAAGNVIYLTPTVCFRISPDVPHSVEAIEDTQVISMLIPPGEGYPDDPK